MRICMSIDINNKSNDPHTGAFTGRADPDSIHSIACMCGWMRTRTPIIGAIHLDKSSKS